MLPFWNLVLKVYHTDLELSTPIIVNADSLTPGTWRYRICINPRPTKPLFVTWFTKGVVTTPLMNLKLTDPKYDCLVPWYRVGSPLSIDTKIMKIGQRMKSQWRFQTWPDSKSGFSVKIAQNWKQNHFFR